MEAQPSLPLYLSSAVREVMPAAVRPGGLRLTQRAVELLGKESIVGKTVVDVGCGRGISLQLFAELGAKLSVGIDRSLLMLGEGETNNTICAVMELLPIHEKCCDIVLTECAWNLSNQQQSLAEFHRVLRIGGVLILSDIFSRRKNGGAAWPVSCCFTQANSLSNIVKMVENSGFTVDTIEDHTSLLKVSAAEFVFRYGTLEKFWEAVTGEKRSAQQACVAGRSMLPGLFLLIARKSK